MVATQLFALLCALISLHNLSETKVASGLRITSIEVPSAAMNSSQVTLVCNYELQGDQLYSVKWYKNYVEFYRFQPSAGNQMQQSAASAQDRDSQQLSFGSKQEFELDGINLNLSKCNATHVHLKQTSLASEGTYKCEVSADTPSFATISSERQMKVYVLPRQKLAIVDNTQSDLINLTCMSAPSKPAARLQWFINDTPISNTSKWLQHHHSASAGTNSDKQQQLYQMYNRNQNSVSAPVEAKLTLAFRLQPHLLAQMAGQPIRSQLASIGQRPEFRCVAEYEIEFVSETSIAVAGGKTTQPKRRNRDQPSNASPLVGQPNGEDLDQPRPIAAEGGHLQATTGVLRLRGEPRPLAANNQTNSLVAPIKHQQLQNQQYQQAVVMLTSKQLRTKADQIEQLLRATRPNELQPPLVEARSQLLDYAELELDQTDPEDENTTTTTTTTTSEETNVRADEEEARRYLQSDGSLSREPDTDTDSDKDYQLNDLVLFTCSLQPPNYPPDRHSKVRFKWLINDKQISSNHVNHFDGNRFLLRADQRKSSSRRNFQQPSSPAEQTSALSDQEPGSRRQSTLLIEFSPSLFQLKELDLKCRTSIEQPLVSYETSLVTSAAAAPIGSSGSSGYIEADPTSGESLQSNPTPARGNKPWITKHSQSQQRRNQVLRLHKQHQQQQHQQSSSAQSSLLITSSPLFLLHLLSCVVSLDWMRR